ncbi:MAG: DUF2520 domain-containing protein [Gammaproteobacteria bacterium]|nr:MAG: DUF2520 domain-containing protein [Gammaproteobacteria bacterium]
MSTISVNFIGCGRLGKTLAKLFKINQISVIKGVITTSLARANEAVQQIGEGSACQTIRELPPADIYFITTPDDLIQGMCEELVSARLIKAGAIVVHCSGLLSSDVLKSAKKAGYSIASLHPIKSFAQLDENIASFAGTYCGVEGDLEAVSVLTHLFKSIGGNVFHISKENKSLYHAACVIANNYLVTLHYQASQCLHAASVDEQIAKEIVSMLMMNSLTHLQKLNHQAALTGPLQRGDVNTIKIHLESLSKTPLIHDIYSQLGIATLALTKHSEEKIEELDIILNEEVKNDVIKSNH